MIISASRRTDIPAFYSEWLVDKIRIGKCIYYNPFNYKGYEISLQPSDVDVLVLWSKNFIPMMKHLNFLKENYNLYLFYTITGLSGIFEKNVISVEEAISNFKDLSSMLSPQQIQWRFDPILVSTQTPLEFYLELFYKISSALEGHTTRCYLSFVNEYDKVKKNFHRKKISLINVSNNEKKDFIRKLADFTIKKGITIYSCCNDFLLDENIKKASCINLKIINKIFGLKLNYNLYPTRKGCGCYKSIDIGVYNTCPHRCLYCYANTSFDKVLKNIKSHDPYNLFLINKKIEVVRKINYDSQQTFFSKKSSKLWKMENKNKGIIY